MKNIFICICLIVGLFACGGDSGDDDSDSSDDQDSLSQGLVFTEEQRLIADQIISVFENDTPVIQYAYAENLNDGRGITAGRAGFTSATGDMLEVVDLYTQLVPDNPLAVYLPRLRELAAEESGSTEGLEDLETAWQTAADDTVFQGVQDDVVDEEYYLPAVEHTKELGISYPLSLLNIYDACIQHGDGDDPDGLPAIISRTTEEVGGTPDDGVDESDWLQAFMDIRRSVLLDPSDQESQEAWSESVGRVDTLVEIFESGNLTLTPPIDINPYGTEYTIPQ